MSAGSGRLSLVLHYRLHTAQRRLSQRQMKPSLLFSIVCLGFLSLFMEVWASLVFFLPLSNDKNSNEETILKDYSVSLFCCQ